MLNGSIPTNGYPYVYDISADRDNIQLPLNLCGGVIEFDMADPGIVGYIGPIPSQTIASAGQARLPLMPPATNGLVHLQFSEVPVPAGANKTQVVVSEQVWVW